VRSVRLDAGLEARLQEAARVTGKPISTLIRDALEAYCDALLKDRPACRLADVIGVVQSTGGRARRTGKAFRETLQAQREEPQR
jgi:Ribbon-helix-helix protein, copG family